MFGIQKWWIISSLSFFFNPILAEHKTTASPSVMPSGAIRTLEPGVVPGTPFPTEIPVNVTLSPIETPINTTLAPTETPMNATLAPSLTPMNATLAPTEIPMNATLEPTDTPLNTTLVPTDISINATLVPTEIPINNTLVPQTAPPTEVPVNEGLETLDPTPMSMNDTLSPTSSSTSEETLSPTTAPSIDSTDTPTTASFIEGPASTPEMPTEDFSVTVNEVGNVLLELVSTPGMLMFDTENKFLVTTRAFLILNIQGIESVTLDIVRQYKKGNGIVQGGGNRRKLQESNALFVDLMVSARRTLSDTETVPFDFDSHLSEVFLQYDKEYVQALKETGDPFFYTLESVRLAIDDDTNPPTKSPTFLPEEEDSALFSLGFIVGIAIGGAVLMALMILFGRHLVQEKRKDTTFNQPQIPASGQHGWRDRNQYAWRRTKRGKPNKDAFSVNSDLESQGLYSYAQDNESFMGGSIIRTNSLAGVDTQSYAYSLEPGVMSVVSGSTLSQKATESVPTEIPRIETNTEGSANRQFTGSSVISSEFGGSGFEAKDIGSPLSEIELTEAELAMLPSNLGNSDEEIHLPTRQVIAPPGKLGVIIDTTVEGPVVHHVDDTSALLGKIWPGDIIIAIDDVDTRGMYFISIFENTPRNFGLISELFLPPFSAMPAPDITALMVLTANKERNLTVIGEPNRQ